ncbi:MAG TPA: ROK family protein [Candidatus Faeciplasma pullistercoris]|uniref:ROK family protein n=1 Tax=Candidatus Faeciplasma pullistercoris TaxID=2840800 RepID=A0A9D1GSD1_9FIRM|nr:ROK family protein [Candidatus Faeciplasma pullistercoris]
MSYYVGIDLGGTNIAAGVVDEKFRIIARSKLKTNRELSGDEVIRCCAEAARLAVENAGLKMENISAVGLGSPGTVNCETGVIEYANNLNFANTPAAEILRSELGIPAYAENDANAAAYAEFVAGSAVGAKDVVCITLGTGVGGGIIIGGKLYSGFNYGGAELGHTVIDINGPECTCGRHGCFEVYSSATGLIRMTIEAMNEHPESLMHSMMGDHVSAKLAFAAMRAGDETAKAVVDKYIKYLAAGITNTINVFQPDILCIGGGVCNEGDNLLIPLREQVAGEVYTRRGSKNTKIVIASLGNDAGIIGAAYLWQSR